MDARRAVGFALAQHPIACLGQVAGDGDDSAAVAFVGCEALIEQSDVALVLSSQMSGAVGCFDEGPLEIAVDVAADAAVMCMATRGDHAGHETGIAGQVFRTSETLDVADLQPQHGRQCLAHAGQCLEQLNLGTGSECEVDVLFQGQECLPRIIANFL